MRKYKIDISKEDFLKGKGFKFLSGSVSADPPIYYRTHQNFIFKCRDDKDDLVAHFDASENRMYTFPFDELHCFEFTLIFKTN